MDTIFGLSPTLVWTGFFVITSFGLYIGIAVWARAPQASGPPAP